MAIKLKDIQSIKAGELTVDTLLELYPVKQLVSDLVNIINENDINPEPIALYERDYNRVMEMFRIVGFDKDGKKITRGRKRKEELREEDKGKEPLINFVKE